MALINSNDVIYLLELTKTTVEKESLPDILKTTIYTFCDIMTQSVLALAENSKAQDLVDLMLNTIDNTTTGK